MPRHITTRADISPVACRIYLWRFDFASITHAELRRSWLAKNYIRRRQHSFTISQRSTLLLPLIVSLSFAAVGDFSRRQFTLSRYYHMYSPRWPAFRRRHSFTTFYASALMTRLMASAHIFGHFRLYSWLSLIKRLRLSVADIFDILPASAT